MSISCPDCGENAKASGTRHIKYRNVQRRIRTCPNGHKFITCLLYTSPSPRDS